MFDDRTKEILDLLDKFNTKNLRKLFDVKGDELRRIIDEAGVGNTYWSRLYTEDSVISSIPAYQAGVSADVFFEHVCSPARYRADDLEGKYARLQIIKIIVDKVLAVGNYMDRNGVNFFGPIPDDDYGRLHSKHTHPAPWCFISIDNRDPYGEYTREDFKVDIPQYVTLIEEELARLRQELDSLPGTPYDQQVSTLEELANLYSPTIDRLADQEVYLFKRALEYEGAYNPDRTIIKIWNDLKELVQGESSVSDSDRSIRLEAIATQAACLKNAAVEVLNAGVLKANPEKPTDDHKWLTEVCELTSDLVEICPQLERL